MISGIGDKFGDAWRMSAPQRLFIAKAAKSKEVVRHQGPTMTNHLYCGDNLQVLRSSIKDESVDLVYLDPPFNSDANYNVLFRSPAGEQSHAQIEAFEDTWHWTLDAERAFDEVMSSEASDAQGTLDL